VRAAVLVALALATFFAFRGVLGNDWILLDDPGYVYENPLVLKGWTWEGARAFLLMPHGANWHPLTSYSHMLDVQLFGARPGPAHAVSLALHVVNALLLLLVLASLTGAWWRSALVAALFALHPLRVESVAWISERKDVLSGFFFFLTIAAYARWAARPGRAHWALVLAALALGLASKPMLVTLPAVLVLLDLWPLGRLSAPRTLLRLIGEKWSLFALALACSVVTFIVQSRSGALASAPLQDPLRRLGNALISYWRYVGLSLWPHGLAPYYPSVRRMEVPAVAAAAAGLALATWLALRVRTRHAYITTGWLWYVGMLLPVIGLIQVGSQSHADRYTYLPTIGLAIALVWTAADLLERWPVVSRAAAVALAAALVPLGLATTRQVERWRDTRTLFTYSLSVTRDNPVAQQCLGDALMIEQKPAEALPHYQAAVRMNPYFVDSHNKLGSALAAMDRNEEAVEQFQYALRLKETADARLYLGFVYESMGRHDDAILELEAALRDDPEMQEAHLLLGAALGEGGRLTEAETHLRRAVELAPRHVEARRLHAEVLGYQGRVPEMLAEYGALLELAPEDVDALVSVAWVRATDSDPRWRDGSEAVRLAQRAQRLAPQPRAVIEETLAAAYAEAGLFADAVAAGERAVALARRSGDAAGAARVAAQLEGYRARRPLRDGARRGGSALPAAPYRP
jgi:tetratricopeptide (TPR) repeat protein